jgi:glycosyltransferase involved in cell wall biosynthesis
LTPTEKTRVNLVNHQGVQGLARVNLSIYKRLEFIFRVELNEFLDPLDATPTPEQIATLTSTLLTRLPNRNSCDCSIIFWLICVGSYPLAQQQLNIESRLQIFGTKETYYWMLERILTNEVLYKNSTSISLQHSPSRHLVDITHTSTYPHITGIQRVVREIANVSKERAEVAFIKWHVSSCTVEILDKKSLFNPTLNLELNETEKQIFQKSFELLYFKLGSWTENGFIRRKTKSLIRRPVRKLRKRITGNETVWNTEDVKLDFSLSLSNVYVFGHTITLLDVGMEHGPLYYPYVVPSSITLQVLLYDFIPIFHPQYLMGSGLSGLFSQYLSYVLKSDRIIAISNLVADQAILLSKAVKLERANWELQETMVEYLNLPSGIHVESSLNNHDEQIESHLFIMIGTIEPRKNHKQFLDALLILSQLDIKCEAKIIGMAGWQNHEVLSYVKECQLLGVQIEILEKISDEDLRSYYKRARAVLMLSQAEGFGLPIIEAQQFGTTVIATRVRPFVDLPVQNIHFVDVGDGLSLAEVMLGLIEIGSPGFSDVTGNDPFTEYPTWQEWSKKLFD